MEAKRVIIVMPCYNAESYVLDAINSVINQTFTNWTLVVIDDCSKDNSYSKICEIKDSRVKKHRNSENRGVSYTRNIGLKEAISGDFVFFIDSDDIWMPNKLEEQLKAMKSGSNIVIAEYNYGDKNKIVSCRTEKLSKWQFINKSYRVCFSSIGFVFNDKLKFKSKGHEDFLFIVDLLGIYSDITICKMPLVNMRKIDGSLSSNKKKAASWHWNNLRDIYGNNMFLVLYAMLNYVIKGVVFSLKYR